MNYRVNEIFYSLQGEGARSGSANVFIRFSGCNIGCNFCDTDYSYFEIITGEEIVNQVRQNSTKCNWVILTGGEPLLQVDKDLVCKLHEAGYFVAVETNGTIDPINLGIDWITMSPKVPEDELRCRQANEVKYVIFAGDPIPKPLYGPFGNMYLSPAYDGYELNWNNIDWCIHLVKENPLWKLSVQQHKMWGIR